MGSSNSTRTRQFFVPPPCIVYDIYFKENSKQIQNAHVNDLWLYYDDMIWYDYVIWLNLFFLSFPFFFTSFPCLMMESLQHEKQNLCVWLLGHWTKCVSSSLPAQLVHLSIGFPSAPTSPSRTCPLLDEETWTSNLGLEELEDIIPSVKKHPVNNNKN